MWLDGQGALSDTGGKVGRGGERRPLKSGMSSKCNEGGSNGFKQRSSEVLICILSKPLAAAWRMDYRGQSRSQGVETEQACPPRKGLLGPGIVWGHTHTHVHLHTHTCAHARTHVHTHMHTHARLHTHVHIHVRTQTCMCMHVHSCTPVETQEARGEVLGVYR